MYTSYHATLCTALQSHLLASLSYAPFTTSFTIIALNHHFLGTHQTPRAPRSSYTRRKHPPLFRIKIRLPLLRRTRPGHRQHPSRHTCCLPQVRQSLHHSLFFHTQDPHRNSMGTAWCSAESYPWEQGLYVGGLETVKVNLTLRIYSNQWHVYAGLAILNPSARIQINQ